MIWLSRLSTQYDLFSTSAWRHVPKHLRNVKSERHDTRDQSGSTKPTLLRAKRGGSFRKASVTLTYEGADAVFNVSSYSGALLLQGTRKTDGGFATTKRLVQRADEGA